MKNIIWASKGCYDFNYPSTYIIAAAIMYEGAVYAGMRHDICYAAIHADHGKYEGAHGFIDNHGEFHDRKESFKIAWKAKQIDRRKGEGKILISEDLW